MYKQYQGWDKRPKEETPFLPPPLHFPSRAETQTLLEGIVLNHCMSKKLLWCCSCRTCWKYVPYSAEQCPTETLYCKTTLGSVHRKCRSLSTTGLHDKPRMLAHKNKEAKTFSSYNVCPTSSAGKAYNHTNCQKKII